MGKNLIDFVVLPVVLGVAAFAGVSALEKMVEIFPFLPAAKDYSLHYGLAVAGITLTYQVANRISAPRKPY